MVENPWRELEQKYKDRIQQEWMAFELFAIVYEHFLKKKFFLYIFKKETFVKHLRKFQLS